MFRNCLVVMRPKATKLDIPSSHDISVYIHNSCVKWLKDLKDDILVSEKIACQCQSTNEMTPGGPWQNIKHGGWMDCRQYKIVISEDDCTLDRGGKREVVAAI